MQRVPTFRTASYCANLRRWRSCPMITNWSSKSILDAFNMKRQLEKIVSECSPRHTTINNLTIQQLSPMYARLPTFASRRMQQRLPTLPKQAPRRVLWSGDPVARLLFW